MMQKWEPETDGQILRRAGKTGEELAELLVVLQRIVIQGYDGVDPKTGQTNKGALINEIADVYAQLDETVEVLGLDRDHAGYIEERRAMKRRWMKEWESHFDKEGPQP